MQKMVNPLPKLGTAPDAGIPLVRNTRLLCCERVWLLLAFVMSAGARARDFTYANFNGAIPIAGYTGRVAL
jgi:hypothetical protein